VFSLLEDGRVSEQPKLWEAITPSPLRGEGWSEGATSALFDVTSNKYCWQKLLLSE